MKLVLATRNIGKVQEFNDMLSNQSGVEVQCMKDFPDAPEVLEDGETYQANAKKKAVHVAKYSGILALADDSGLEVDALGGAPGVHSARYAGSDASDADRIAKLLAALRHVPDNERNGRFKCAVAVASPGGRTDVVVGVCDGSIIREPRGELGFGYDPVFVPNGFNQSFAELGEQVKNRISHRAKALNMALKLIKDTYMPMR
ncbi:MAG: XTP/dITP diphosphatase [Candidatus Poribacteria bacterium]|nr:XTP/dITP diphosphatase [Candidatus Poribacteria bacterium]MDE0505566.1 XTP/dITP diphosphatase [Candidatus Poribacteria bacterium]